MELLELVAEDEKRQAARSSKSRRRKKSGASAGSPAAAASSQQLAGTGRYAAAEAVANNDATADAAPSTPRKAEQPLPTIQDSSAEASLKERRAQPGAAMPPPRAASPASSEHASCEHEAPQQLQHGGQAQGVWEVQQRGRKARRGPRQPNQGQPSASPSPLAGSRGTATEARPAARIGQQTPPPQPPAAPPQQQPRGSKQQPVWASIVSGAASTPMDATTSWPLQSPQSSPRAAWPQLPTNFLLEEAASPLAAPPQPVRLRPDLQQQPIAPGSRQPPPGFPQRTPPSVQQQQQQHHPPPPLPAANGSVSRRSSTEYSLWGEDSCCQMPLSLSASRESLTSASDMSFSSPPLAGGLHNSGILPAGKALFKQPPSGKPLSSPAPRLFQHFGSLAPSIPQAAARPVAAPAAPCSAGDDFSLFSSFPAASSQRAAGKGSRRNINAWADATPVGFGSLFGGSSILGRKTMAQTMLV